jgi:hypothetical protein
VTQATFFSPHFSLPILTMEKNMKFQKSLMIAIATGALFCAGAAMAQDTSSGTDTSSGMQAGNSAVYQTAKGQVTVRSVNAPAMQAGPAPSFEQLSGGKKSITPDQAAAYPPLANDFLHADSNRDGHVSKSEYSRWVKKL